MTAPMTPLKTPLKMVPNDSSTGGFLTPVDPQGLADDRQLEDLFQPVIAGITGLAGEAVKPEWQMVFPRQWEADESWCTFLIATEDADDGPYMRHIVRHDGSSSSDGNPDGETEYQRHQTLELVMTFHGPAGQQLAGVLRDGLTIAQNRERLEAARIRFVSCRDVISVPELVNQTAFRRYDVHATFRRKIVRRYRIRNVASAGIGIEATDSATGTAPISRQIDVTDP